MAREARRVKRAQREAGTSRQRKERLRQPLQVERGSLPPQLNRDYFKSALARAAIPVAGVWMLGLLIYGVSQSSGVRLGALLVPAVITVLVAGVFVWALRQARKARGVADILAGAADAEGREQALERLESEYKGKDPAKIFAKAQLLMQTDPRQALSVLEEIELGKVQAAIADQARAQRALIQLTLGEVTDARDLADGIDIQRHKDLQSRAFMSSVIAEAWARSGQAKKAEELLKNVDADEPSLAQLQPQLFRARAFVAAYRDNLEGMRAALRKLEKLDPRLLAGFLMKRSHPLLQREAKRLLEQSGMISRKMQVQRRP